LLVNLSLLMQKPTGISTYARNLAPYLRSLDPLFLTSTPLEDFPCYPVPSGMTPEQGTPGHTRRLWWTQVRLPGIYRQVQANLLFSPVPEAPLSAGCRSVVMVHDLIPLRFPRRFSPLTLYTRHLVPLVLQQACHIVCNSTATATDITDFFGIPAQKITPIPLAYDRPHFRFLDLPRQNYFLYLGRIDPYKNVQRLIDAFAQIASGTDYQLWLAGPPDSRFLPILITQVEELGLTEKIRWLHYVPYDQLPMLLNQAIALVFPSLWEGFGLPVLEAMACGTPVIASNRSAIPEVTGDAAWLIEPTDGGAIAAAMRTVAMQESLRLHLRTAGLARAAQFSWEQTGQHTAQVLEKFL